MIPDVQADEYVYIGDTLIRFNKEWQRNLVVGNGMWCTFIKFNNVLTKQREEKMKRLIVLVAAFLLLSAFAAYAGDLVPRPVWHRAPEYPTLRVERNGLWTSSYDFNMVGDQFDRKYYSITNLPTTYIDGIKVYFNVRTQEALEEHYNIDLDGTYSMDWFYNAGRSFSTDCDYEGYDPRYGFGCIEENGLNNSNLSNGAAAYLDWDYGLPEDIDLPHEYHGRMYVYAYSN